MKLGKLLTAAAGLLVPAAMAHAYTLSLSTALAVPLGLYAAARRGRAGDTVVIGMTQLGLAVPNFWLGMLLVLLFAIGLRWVSAGGFPGISRRRSNPSRRECR